MGSYFNGLVGTYSLSDGAVTSAKIADGTIAPIDLQVGTALANIGAAGVTAAYLAAGAAAGNLGAGSITSGMLASGVAAANLAAGSVTASMLAAGAAASNIGGLGVTTAMLNTGAVTNAKLAANATMLTPNTLANRPSANSVVAGTLYFATDVGGGTLYASDGSSTWTQIGNGLTSATVADGSITSAKIADGSIINDDLARSFWQSILHASASRAHGEILPNAALTGFVGDGSLSGTAPTTGGTVTSPNGYMTLTTPATINTDAYVHAGYVGARLDRYPSFAARVSSINGSSANVWTGLFPSSPLGTTCPSGGMGFRVLNGNNVYFVYNVGAGEVAVDTGCTATGFLMFDFFFDQAGTVNWRVRRISGSTGSFTVEYTGQVAGLSLTTTTVGPFAGVRTTTGSSTLMKLDALGYILSGSAAS